MKDDFEIDQRQRGESMLLGPLEQACPALLFTEYDRRQAYKSIEEGVIDLNFYVRLNSQVRNLNSHQAAYFLDEWNTLPEVGKYTSSRQQY